MMLARPLLVELRSYLGLGSADADLLSRFRAVAEPHFGAIADEFYAVIRMHEGAFSVLKDEAQARRLHASLQAWLGDLLGGTYDEGWVERQARIGQVHVRVGLELRYVVTAMGRVRTALQRIASQRAEPNADAAPQARQRAEPNADAAPHARQRAEPNADEGLGGESLGLRLAVARVCDLALALMLESYKDDLLRRVERATERERQSIVHQLDERERVLHEALEAADVIVLTFDAAWHLVFANRRARELTGYALDELADADAFTLLFGDRAVQARASLLGATGTKPAELEAEIRTRSGKARLVRWSASTAPAGEDGAAPGGFVVTGTDVTRERDLERRARQNERLASAGALAAGLAHEIRNPLNGASLHVEVLDRALARARDVSPAAYDATSVLRAEIRRLSSLVSDFLDVARPKPLARVECDLNDIAQAVGALLAPEAQARKVTLRVERFPFPAIASVDGERIKQVLVNLVRNGIEAVSDGGQVWIRVRRVPHEVEVDIADDGPGIPDPQAPIFDAFYTTKDRGTGLGLSIVQRIVSDHGGDVVFASQPGSTTFTVRLPADSAHSVL
jgi:PAS domain S-box-containing protein